MRTPASAPAGRSRTASVMEGLRVGAGKTGARNGVSADRPTGPPEAGATWRQHRADNTSFANKYGSSASIPGNVRHSDRLQYGVNAKRHRKPARERPRQLEAGVPATIRQKNAREVRARSVTVKKNVPPAMK